MFTFIKILPFLILVGLFFIFSIWFPFQLTFGLIALGLFWLTVGWIASKIINLSFD